ncbi:MAG: hypothetical protein M1818_002606 [Claussenomyces sp. TS43310]|nr:MAG: hypothetical protein M1818_002606 [Claussenomyces sp. TS43310]
MPIYTIHTRERDTEKLYAFASDLAKLHARTFDVDPQSVRMEFLLPSAGPSEIHRWGGYGFRPKKGIFSPASTSDYIVAHVNFYGPPELWRDFCRRVSKLYGPALASIYLHRLNLEFEAGDLVSGPEAERTGRAVDAHEDEAPPEYNFIRRDSAV